MTRFYERKTGFPADFVDGSAYGDLYACEFSVQHCGQLFRGTDQ